MLLIVTGLGTRGKGVLLIVTGLGTRGEGVLLMLIGLTTGHERERSVADSDRADDWALRLQSTIRHCSMTQTLT